MSKHYLVFVQDHNGDFKCKKKLGWPSFTVDFGGHPIYYQLFMTSAGRDSVKHEHVEEAHVYDTTMKDVTFAKAKKIWLDVNKRKSQMDCEECDCMKRKTAYRIQMVLDASKEMEASALAQVEVNLKPKHLSFVQKLVLDDLDEYLGYLSEEYSESRELVLRRIRYYFEHTRQ